MENFPKLNLPILSKPGIYAFRNKVNGKVYVGQSKDVRKRRKEHEGKTSSNSRRFHNALKFHGVDAFEFSVIEYCDFDALDERETYWIAHLDSVHPNGYNLKSGGGALHEHHPETKAIMSSNQKELIAKGKHKFTSIEFQIEQANHQRELARRGLHSSQDPVVKAKRDDTVKSKIERFGKLFTHTPESIERIRNTQKGLYDVGQGSFQKPDLIEENKKRVKDALATGTHFSQRENWSEQARKAAKKQMKMVWLAIRLPDGRTSIEHFESLHAASDQLEIDRRHLSKMCRDEKAYKSLMCNIGLVIRGSTEENPSWNSAALEEVPTSQLINTMPVLVTIELSDSRIIEKSFISQHAACNALEAEHKAFRWILKGEKYKSTKCNVGRIVKVTEIEPQREHIEMMIQSRAIKATQTSQPQKD